MSYSKLFYCNEFAMHFYGPPIITKQSQLSQEEIDLLQDPNWRVRLQAARSIESSGEFPGSHYWDYLFALMKFDELAESDNKQEIHRLFRLGCLDEDDDLAESSAMHLKAFPELSMDDQLLIRIGVRDVNTLVEFFEVVGRDKWDTVIEYLELVLNDDPPKNVQRLLQESLNKMKSIRGMSGYRSKLIRRLVEFVLLWRDKDSAADSARYGNKS